MATIGQQLKRAREERSQSVEDVAFHTRIPAARLRDLENDDLSRFANLTYARGFLKLYGEYLELDLSDYLVQFRTEEFAHASGHEYVQTAQATQNLPASVVVDQGRARRPGLYLLGLAVLAAGVIVWMNQRPDPEEEQDNQAAVAEVKPVADPPAAEPPASPAEKEPGPALAEAEPPLLPQVQPLPPEPPVAINTSTATNPAAATNAPAPPKAKIIEEP